MPLNPYVKALEECSGIEQEDVRKGCVAAILREARDLKNDLEQLRLMEPEKREDIERKLEETRDPRIIAAASKICASIQQENIRQACVASMTPLR